jgi:hypothetical protein
MVPFSPYTELSGVVSMSAVPYISAITSKAISKLINEYTFHPVMMMKSRAGFTSKNIHTQDKCIPLWTSTAGWGHPAGEGSHE